MEESLRQRIQSLVDDSEIVLFMKGDRRMPQCGFSARVVALLDDVGAAYATHDVLGDPALRDGIKAFSEWPTIPQLYVRGEFIGGCDIVSELHQTGELVGTLAG